LNEEVFGSLAVTERWRLDYNHVRPHKAHGGLTPDAVAEPRGRAAAQFDQLRRPAATAGDGDPPIGSEPILTTVRRTDRWRAQ